MEEKPGRWPPPPAVLDGADVLYCGIVREFIQPKAAALCSCPGASEVYLFYCNNRWQVVEDTLHDSVEEAVAALEQRHPQAWGKLKWAVSLACG